MKLGTKNSLYIYFLSHYLFLGGGFATICKIAGKDAYIGAIVGFFLGISIIYLIYKLSKLEKNTYIFKTIFIIFIIINIFILLLFLASFLYSYFLFFTPSIFTLLPLLLLALYINKKGDKTILNVSFLLLFISLFIVLSKNILLIKEYDISNILPIFTTSSSNIIKVSLIYALLSTSPIFILINDNLEFKSMLKFYTLANTTNILILLSMSFILGNTICIYSFPEYTILRRIKVSSFLENIENFMCVNWFFDSFITLSLFINKLKITTSKKYYIPSIIILVIILLIVSIFFASNYKNIMYVYNYFPYVLLVIITLLTCSSFFKKN